MTNTNMSTTAQSSTAIAVVNLDTHRITRGQLAWSRIKATAAEQRELWRQVGEALLVGRRRNPADTMFKGWCDSMGFKDVKPRYRSAAMWLAENWAEVGRSITPTVSDPVQLQKDYAEITKEAALAHAGLADLTITEKPSVTLDQRSAEKLAKLINRSTSGDEGSETAKRHVESIAKKHGVSSEELKEVVANTAPATFYHFSPAQVEMLADIEETVMGTVVSMEAEGLSREAIAAVFIKIAHQIKGEQA